MLRSTWRYPLYYIKGPIKYIYEYIFNIKLDLEGYMYLLVNLVIIKVPIRRLIINSYIIIYETSAAIKVTRGYQLPTVLKYTGIVGLVASLEPSHQPVEPQTARVRWDLLGTHVAHPPLHVVLLRTCTNAGVFNVV